MLEARPRGAQPVVELGRRLGVEILEQMAFVQRRRLCHALATAVKRFELTDIARERRRLRDRKRIAVDREATRHRRRNAEQRGTQASASCFGIATTPEERRERASRVLTAIECQE